MFKKSRSGRNGSEVVGIVVPFVFHIETVTFLFVVVVIIFVVFVVFFVFVKFVAFNNGL